MKNTKLYFFYFNIIITTFFLSSHIAIADVSNILLKRLNKISNFYVSFTQIITDYNGNTIQRGQGKLWFKYPNLFRWHLLIPHDNLIVSDGKNIWLYNKIIQQVNVFLLSEIKKQTPLTLFIQPNLNNLKNYIIKQKNDNFTLIPKKHSAISFDKLNISITNKGKINNFSTVEVDGKNIYYNFKNYNYNKISSKKFIFKHSKYITINDQR